MWGNKNGWLLLLRFDLILCKEILALKDRLNQIYAKHTKKTESEIKKALERDKFMTPEEAKQFGLIDEVVEKRS